jgi:hypothetical protein
LGRSRSVLLEGGYPGYIHSDLAFLAQVQNVQVDYTVGTQNRICPLRDETVEVRPDQITEFWASFAKRCPRAKRVIVNQCLTPVPSVRETHRVPRALQVLVQSSPTGIRASAFIVEKEVNVPAGSGATTLSAQKWQRAVYQLSADSRWEKVKSSQVWKMILVPAKRFSGPVGHFQELLLRG